MGEQMGAEMQNLQNAAQGWETKLKQAETAHQKQLAERDSTVEELQSQLSLRDSELTSLRERLKWAGIGHVPGTAKFEMGQSYFGRAARTASSPARWRNSTSTFLRPKIRRCINWYTPSKTEITVGTRRMSSKALS